MSFEQPFEMMRKLVEQRKFEGVPPDQIRAELAAMGVSRSDADRLLVAEGPKDLQARAPIEWWDILPVIPLWLAPVVLMILSAFLERPQFAIAMAVTGSILHAIGRISMIILAFSEGILWGILLFFCPCIVDLMLLITQWKKFWKVWLCGFVGVLMITISFMIDPEAVAKFFDIKIEIEASRIEAPAAERRLATSAAWEIESDQATPRPWSPAFRSPA